MFSMIPRGVSELQNRSYNFKVFGLTIFWHLLTCFVSYFQLFGSIFTLDDGCMFMFVCFR